MMLRAVLLCLLFAASGVGLAQQYQGQHFIQAKPAETSISPKDVALVPANVYQQTGAAPTGTTSTTAVMMGLNGQITPRGDGVVLMMLSGDLVNNTGSDGGTVQLRYGTGAAPINGAAITGTPCSGTVNDNNSGTTRDLFAVQCAAIGLQLGTTYWIDAAVAAVTGGTATIADISLTAVEE